MTRETRPTSDESFCPFESRLWAAVASVLLGSACHLHWGPREQSAAAGLEPATAPAAGAAPSSGGNGAPANIPLPPLPVSGTAPRVDVAMPAAPTLIGRFDTLSPDGPRLAWPGSTIEASFTGSSLAVRWREGPNLQANLYDVTIDGVIARFEPRPDETATYVLGENLTSGVHSVRLHKRTEGENGEAQFLGFELAPGGALVPAPQRLARRLEFIGDSITAGYGNEGIGPSCGYSPETQNHAVSYANLAAVALGAEQTTLAYSGRGLVKNYDGSTTGTLPELVRRVLPDDAASRWSFAEPAPDAVIVNLGQNDFAWGPPDEQTFTAAYLELLEDLRRRYPRAVLVAAIGPMLNNFGEPNGETRSLDLARRWIDGLVATRRARGDARVHFLEFPEQDEAQDGLGCDWHPSLATHRRMAVRLVERLRTELGW